MRDIFISHSSLDKEIAEDVCQEFEKIGFSCWISYRIKDLKPGKVYTEEITEAISNSRFFVALLSNNSIRSEQVQQEVILANERQKYGLKIFPVIIDEVMSKQYAHPSMDYVFAGKEKIVWTDITARTELIGQMESNFQSKIGKYEMTIISHLPEPINIIGRKKELEEISCLVDENGKVCLSGMGGIGKTALLQSFCNDFLKTKYTSVVYLPVEKCLLRTLANDEFLAFDNDDISQVRASMSDYEYAFYKLAILENSVNKSTLIVFDNIESGNDPLFERICKLNCKVIIATRYPELEIPTFKKYHICEIKEEGSIKKLFEAYFVGQLTEQDCSALDKLTADINYHTMMVILIAKQMSYFGKRPSDYRNKDQLWMERTKNLGQMVSSNTYGNIIGDIYNQIFNLFNARMLSDDEKKVMKTLSLLPVSGTYRHLYLQLIGENYASTVSKLELLGWIQSNGIKSIIMLHPLVRDVAVNELELYMEDPHINQFVGNFIHLISDSWNRVYEENIKMKEIALSLYFQFPIPTLSRYKNYLVLSKYLWIINCMDISIEIQNKVSLLFVNADGTHMNTPEEAEALLLIGFTYQGKGDYRSAEHELAQAVKIYGNKFASALSHQAQAQMFVGERSIEEIEPLLQLSLNIREKYWSDTISEATSCHLYAKTLSNYNTKLDLAIKLEKKAYRIFTKLQPGGVNLSSAAYILGWLYVLTAEEDDDDLEYGIMNLEEAKKIRIQHRGDPIHPWMEDIYLKLGIAHKKKKDMVKAKEYFELLLQVREKKFKDNLSQQQIIDAHKKLKEVYKELGDTDGEQRCEKYLRYNE